MISRRLRKLECDARSIKDQRWLELKRTVETFGKRRCMKLFDQYRLKHYDAAEFDALPFAEKCTFVHRLHSALDPFALHADEYDRLKSNSVSYRYDPIFECKSLGCLEAERGHLEDAEGAFKASIAEARENRMPWREAVTWHDYIEHVLKPRGTCAEHMAEHMAEHGRCISRAAGGRREGPRSYF